MSQFPLSRHTPSCRSGRCQKGTKDLSAIVEPGPSQAVSVQVAFYKKQKVWEYELFPWSYSSNVTSTIIA